MTGAPGEAQRRAIAKAITLLESRRPDHRDRADALLTALPVPGAAVVPARRLGRARRRQVDVHRDARPAPHRRRAACRGARGRPVLERLGRIDPRRQDAHGAALGRPGRVRAAEPERRHARRRRDGDARGDARRRGGRLRRRRRRDRRRRPERGRGRRHDRHVPAPAAAQCRRRPAGDQEGRDGARRPGRRQQGRPRCRRRGARRRPDRVGAAPRRAPRRRRVEAARDGDERARCRPGRGGLAGRPGVPVGAGRSAAPCRSDAAARRARGSGNASTPACATRFAPTPTFARSSTTRSPRSMPGACRCRSPHDGCWAPSPLAPTPSALPTTTD